MQFFYFFLSEQLILGCLQDFILSHTRYLTTFKQEQLVRQVSLDLFYHFKDSFNMLKVGTSEILINNNHKVGVLLIVHLFM